MGARTWEDQAAEKESLEANTKEAVPAAVLKKRRTRGGRATTAPRGEVSPTQNGGSRNKVRRAPGGALRGSAVGTRDGERLRPPRVQEEKKDGERLRLPTSAKEHVRLARERLRLLSQPRSRRDAPVRLRPPTLQQQANTHTKVYLVDGQNCSAGQWRWPR